MHDMDIKDRIIKAKVDLMDKPGDQGKPFFAYLLTHLNEGQEIPQSMEIPTAGVDYRGYMTYNPKWMNTLSHNQIQFVLVHEVLHCALNHLSRIGNRHPQIMNIATDMVINNMLQHNGFEFPPEVIEPHDNKAKIVVGNQEIWIKEIDKKFSESIYDELYKKFKDKNLIPPILKCRYGMPGKGKGQPMPGQGEGMPQSFDYHKYGDGEGGGKDDEKSKREVSDIAEKWAERMVGAAQHARERGKLPAGMNRFIDKLLNKKLNWRSLLSKYITSNIKFDNTWSYPSKKSFSCGYYMPSPLRESIDVVVAVDTSGSISQEELTQFLTEIVSLGKSFNNIEITIIICDAKVHETYVVRNGDIPRILSLKISGRGGTSHFPVIKWLNENKPNARCLVNLTDGYSDIEQCFKDLPGACDAIICLTENGCDPKEMEKYGRVVKMES